MFSGDQSQQGNRGPIDPGTDTAKPSIAWALDWNLLRTFMVVAEHNSITGAAQYLGLKQPTVSNALSRLETTLGYRLAERGPRNFSLTRHGQALFEECHDLFGTIGRLPNLLSGLGDEIEGHINIAMASHVVTPLLDRTLADFHKNNPKASFAISIESSRDVVESVVSQRASFGICLMREERQDLAARLFYREHFGFFCGPTHPLFGKENLSLKDLAGEDRVTFSTDNLGDVLHSVAALRAQVQFSDRLTGVSNNLEEVRRMIMAGMGIGPLPVHVVDRDVKNGRLWPLPPYQDTPEVDIFLIHNPRANLNRAEAALLEMLSSLIDDTPIAERTYGSKRPDSTLFPFRADETDLRENV